MFELSLKPEEVDGRATVGRLYKDSKYTCVYKALRTIESLIEMRMNCLSARGRKVRAFRTGRWLCLAK